MTTPEFAPVRYETTFFHAELPANEWPTILEGELVGGRFLSPGEAMRQWLEGELLIVPPVLIMLRILAEHGPSEFYERTRDEARRYIDGSLHPVYFTPGVLLAPLATPTLPPATTTNCYVVGQRELWIVDPASWDESEQERLFDLVDGLVADGREVKGVLVTHHHEDHVGAVVPTSLRYDVPVFGHPLTLERLPEGNPTTVPIEDGHVIELGRGPDGCDDWTLRALHTPGHDRGHLSFLESRYGAAIVGDLCSSVSTIIIDPPEGHLATYLRSLQRMLEEPVSTLYPAHGPAVRDGHGLIRQYLAHREDREEALLAALGEAPRAAAEIVPEVYSDVDESLHGYAARSLLAGLQKLAEEGRAQEHEAGWSKT